MAAAVIPWSYSSLDAFVTCPRRFQLVRLTRQVPDPPGQAVVHGREVHKAIELAIKGTQPLPDKYKHLWPLVERCLRAPGLKLVEYQWALNERFMPVPYFDKAAWVRGVIDFAAIDGERAVVLDWKTGAPKNDPDQLRLFAAATFAHQPQVQEVVTGYAWLAHDKLTTERFTRSQLPELWPEFIARVKRLQAAQQTNTFPPQHSGLCRKHCPVPKSLCEFSGRQ